MNLLRKFSILIVTVCFILLCARLVRAYRADFSDVEEDYKSHLSVNLDRNVEARDIESVLLNRNYFSDTADARLVAKFLTDSLKAGRELASLYSLRMNSWKLPVSILEGLDSNRSKLTAMASKARSVVSDFDFISDSVLCDSSSVNLASGNGSISVRVMDNGTVVAGVSVNLCLHTFDSNALPQSTVVAIAITSAQGEASFVGLDTAASYSVLPVREGYEYGRSQGTVGGTLGRTAKTPSGIKDKLLSLFKKQYGNLNFTFNQQPLRVPIFDDATLRAIRYDHAFTLRTPTQWKGIVTRSAVLFLVCWFALCFVMWLRRRGDAVYWPVAAFIGLTGIGLLGMFSFNDPLADKLIAADYMKGVVTGVVVMALLQFVDLKKLFRSPWFDWLGTKLNSKGVGYYLIALLLTLLLFSPLGRSVGGMGVNLKIGPLTFQPSEIAKYLIVFFMSAWFCRKADSLVGYSSEGNISLTWNKLRHVSGIFIALFCMLLIYLVLGDMGPGLVLLFSFIIIYSVVKSKGTWSGGEQSFLSSAVKSDIFLLLVGVLSFLLMVWIGGKLQSAGIFAAVWFAVWIVWWAAVKRQFVETPVMANIVISVFLFARNLPGSIGERFAIRSEMCSNPWGDLEGIVPSPAPNSQVAEGLWGLASGGFFGQGFGNGSPNYIPAFHTDMVLSSLGEQMGWLGLLVVVFLLLTVLHHTVAVGYRSRNHFAFFVCLGIAVVTAVQFAVIALGSTGVIPLTGVVVPLLSYGKVSMIMTLMAFGLVLSVEAHTFAPREENAADRAADNLFRPYSAPVAVTRMAWFVLSMFILCVFARTMMLKRNNTLIRPLYVTSVTGENLVQYNPRIADIQLALQAGNIYDRNGVLLATSEPDSVKFDSYADFGVDVSELKEMLSHRTRRYYPLGDRLLFMVGDANQGSAVSSTNLGYMAEWQHMSYLRGFDNVMYEDSAHTIPKKVDIVSNRYVADRYQPSVELASGQVVLRDYSALLPLLKAGRRSGRIERVNNRKSRYIKPQDLHLTLDAKLQCRLQDEMENYVKDIPYYKYKKILRISVVVLDANNGDMLASALYPMPNKDTLRRHDYKYNDKIRFKNNQSAYTESDLGLTYPTPPGSTAKVMTALAGLQKDPEIAAKMKYYIAPEERVEVNTNTGKGEPSGHEVTMEEAIVWSSNCYFINLLHDMELYSSLDSIYTSIGAQIGDKKDNKLRLVRPYCYQYRPLSSMPHTRTLWNEIMSKQSSMGVSEYRKYMISHDKRDYKKMQKGYWMWAWGQGTLSTSPLSMARVVSVVANGGVMPKTRFRLDEPIEDGIRIVGPDEAKLLKGYMQTMARNANGTADNAIKDDAVGGKTGTPERRLNDFKKPNDGWFIFYVDGCNVKTGNQNSETHTLAIAVRMERLNDSNMGSGLAMRFSRDLVLTVLKELGYYRP